MFKTPNISLQTLLKFESKPFTLQRRVSPSREGAWCNSHPVPKIWLNFASNWHVPPTISPQNSFCNFHDVLSDFGQNVSPRDPQGETLQRKSS